MQRATLDLWVGIFVVVGILAILFLALKVGNMGAFDSAQTYVVKASFDNIGGLKVRAPVKSAGVVVGRVSDVSFDSAEYEAIVSLNLDARYKFPGHQRRHHDRRPAGRAVHRTGNRWIPGHDEGW
jgi:phospholipid/cholesterol/gamma-HCH transport system substrate-binding protein